MFKTVKKVTFVFTTVMTVLFYSLLSGIQCASADTVTNRINPVECKWVVNQNLHFSDIVIKDSAPDTILWMVPIEGKAFDENNQQVEGTFTFTDTDAVVLADKDSTKKATVAFIPDGTTDLIYVGEFFCFPSSPNTGVSDKPVVVIMFLSLLALLFFCKPIKK